MVQTFPDGAESFQQDGDTIGTGPTRSWMVKTLLLLFSSLSGPFAFHLIYSI